MYVDTLKHLRDIAEGLIWLLVFEQGFYMCYFGIDSMLP